MPEFIHLAGLRKEPAYTGNALENGARPRTVLNHPARELESCIALARSLVSENPKRAAQVIRKWLASEA